jgi:hypothetical protein
MRSRLGILSAFVGVVVVGVLAFALFVALRQTPHAFSLGVQSAGAVVTLKDGQEVCQAPIDVPAGAAFDRIRVRLGTFSRTGPEVAVAVHDTRGATVARGTLAAGYPDITEQTTHAVALDHRVPAGTRGLSVCLENRGENRVGVYGNGDAAASGSTAKLNGKPANVDIELVFERAPRSYGAQLSSLLDRAVLFRSPRLAGALYFVLLALLVAVAIGGVAVALRGVGDLGEPGDEPGPSTPSPPER